MAQEPTLTVQFHELEGTRRESWTAEGRTASMQVECAWSDRQTLANELRGGTRFVAGRPVTYYPARYPDDDTMRVAAVVLVHPFIDGAAASTTARYMSYSKAVLDIRYTQQRDADWSGDYRITDAIDTDTRFMSLPHQDLWWTPTDLRIGPENAPGKQIKVVTWTRTVTGIGTLPAALIDLAGRVNTAQITCPAPGASALVFPPETLLYEGPRNRQGVDTDGGASWTVDIAFAYQNLGTPASPRGASVTVGGWNHFFRAGQSACERIYASAAADDIYRPCPLGDLTGLINALS